MRTCNCEEWQDNILRIDMATTISSVHGYPLPNNFVYFRYCPWCGKELYEEFVGDSDHEHDDRIL